MAWVIRAKLPSLSFEIAAELMMLVWFGWVPFPTHSAKIKNVLLFQPGPGFTPGGKALFIFFLCNAVPFSAIMYYLRP